MTPDGNPAIIRDVVGLIPAAGTASRIAPLPCSKEVWPVGFGPGRPVVAAEYLLGAMADAGIPRAFVVLRRGKWDVPAYLSDASCSAPSLAFVVVPATAGVPFTVERARPWIRGRTVAFGFPDIIFRPAGVFTVLLAELEATGAGMVLGLYPASDPRKMDMVELADGGRVRDIVIKPERTELRLTWIHCVWRPAFTEFLHGFLDGAGEAGAASKAGGEVYLGDVIREAIHAGMDVNGVVFDDGEYLDIGTPEDLARVGETTRRWESG